MKIFKDQETGEEYILHEHVDTPSGKGFVLVAKPKEPEKSGMESWIAEQGDLPIIWATGIREGCHKLLEVGRKSAIEYREDWWGGMTMAAMSKIFTRSRKFVWLDDLEKWVEGERK